MALNRTPLEDIEAAAAQDAQAITDNPGGAISGAPLPPAGTANVKTGRWADVQWDFTEPEPAGVCTGFEVAIYRGANIDSGQVAVPVMIINDPEARRHIELINLRSQVDLRAAVRACYGEFRSEWADAQMASTFIPNTQAQSSNSGIITLPDGTIMQWLTSNPITGQQDVIISWPQPFPDDCYCAMVTPLMDTADTGNDNWLQLRSKTKTNVTVYKQTASYISVGNPLRAHIVGWGR